MANIIDPIKEINEAIPELESIRDYDNNDFVSIKNWKGRMKSITTKNLRKYKKAEASYGIYFNPCVIAIYVDDQIIEFNKKKYALIRKYLLSEEFNLLNNK